MISFEKLILAFKEFDLSQNIQTPENTQIVSCNETLNTINDRELLQKILPENICSQMFSRGKLNLLAFIFALKHKIVLLNMMFHYKALNLKECEENKPDRIELEKTLGTSILEEYSNIESYLQPSFWGKSHKVPILGFSAIGCYLVMREIAHCRAFDGYDILHCQSKEQNIFCEIHTSENFWSNIETSKASTQAKLAEFYLNTEHFYEYNEKSLNDLVNAFFARFKLEKEHNFYSQEKIKFALHFYNFLNFEELKILGIVDLRRRFLLKAKECHPDIGGAHSTFLETRQCYEILHHLLKK